MNYSKSTYVALLRGINVGGNNIIKMNELKECFEELGFSDVKTYIASGNVVFSSNEKASELISKIEECLRKTFKYKAIIVLKSYSELKLIISGFPKNFKNSEWKHNVIFLGEDIDKKSIMNSLEIKNDIETISYKKGVIYWSAQMKNITKSNMLKISSKPEYQRMTVRNQNTTRKILELMEKK